ncbi:MULTISPECIES: hypothetical protein [Gracilibacillus]|uniref:hypothetical protein n=1 Tax=Gracilibacillus TaxID=74385 RepID=UPI000825FA1E|nr:MULTISPECIES: hypothetical protein [Gracilibacillus]
MADLSPAQTPILSSKSKTSLVIPFVFSQKSVDTSIWENVQLQWSSSLLDHINQLFATEEHPAGNGIICDVYRLHKQKRDSFGLPKNESNTFHLLNDKGMEWTFKVEDIQLFLFESYVGFLVYDIIHTQSQMEEIVTLNYQLKHLQHFDKGRLITQKEKFTGAEAEPRNFASITVQLLTDFAVEHYFSSLQHEPKVATVFNFVLIDKGFKQEADHHQKLHYHLFQLTHSYKTSYRPAADKLNADRNDSHIELFENSYWGVSFEGMTNLAFLTEDKQNNAFFLGNYRHNMKTYFHLYILALHQRFGLLHFNSLASQLPYSDEILLDGEHDRKVTIPKLRKRINFFILRCYFLHVSNITHQQQLYNKLATTLNIPELKSDLAVELDALFSIAEIEKQFVQEKEKEQEQKREKQEQLRREKNADTVLLYSTVFVIISGISGAWAIIADLFIWNNEPVVQFPAVYVLVILSVISIILGMATYYFIKNKWR